MGIAVFACMVTWNYAYNPWKEKMKESVNGKRFNNMGKGDGRRNVNEDLDEKKEEEEGESRLNSPELGHTYLIGEQGEYYVLTPVRRQEWDYGWKI